MLSLEQNASFLSSAYVVSPRPISRHRSFYNPTSAKIAKKCEECRLSQIRLIQISGAKNAGSLRTFLESKWY